jgi:hypothetical protein
MVSTIVRFREKRCLRRRRGEVCVHSHGGHFELLLLHVQQENLLIQAFRFSVVLEHYILELSSSVI